MSDTALYVSVVIICGCSSDYMDRFLDEGESVGGGATWRDNRSSSPSLHTLLYGKPPPGTSIMAGSGGGGVGLSGGGGGVGGSPAVSAPPTQVVQPSPVVDVTLSDKDCGEAGVTYSGLNQMEDLARHLDTESIDSLAKMSTAQSNTISITRTNRRTSSPHPMDVDLSISRSSVLSPQAALSVEAKNIAKAETVAQ